ncbi:TBC1 domain family member 30 isoform X2 [Protopterus annectens]|uniref:TBC1 domain family member 30 isoform X2 n=1 Tax=Protopterus annectens TaxID=7888 RepID=UPI001CF9BAE5|nr:TBC1 domain family member 30 isoform X2 [Protopterus annectens]
MESADSVTRKDFSDVDIVNDNYSDEGEDDLFVNSSGGTLARGFHPPVFQQWIPTQAVRPLNEVLYGGNDSTTSSRVVFPVGKTAAWNKDPIAAESGEIEVLVVTESSDSPGNKKQTDEPSNRHSRTQSIVDGLLTELYDTYTCGARNAFDSVDSSTEASSSDAFLGRSNSGSRFLQELQEKQTRRHQMNYLAQKEIDELKRIIEELRYRIGVQSAKLIRQLKRKDRSLRKIQKNCDVVTACLQAVSQKRRIDTKLKFTLEPSLGKSGFQQWYDALKAVARLPTGIPKEWRQKVWLTLADQYLHSISIDWEKTMRFTFNDRSNPDDDSMGIQIVKDLHRTGCSSYCGQEAEQDRVVLKRVLLAYARWNKSVGYCQGFNVLAALILEVMEGSEGDALKVMIYLIDKVLPNSYFANNLRALSVDMAVFRDLLRLKLPELSQHLYNLQKTSRKESGGGYEPPLTNVFTMQWFLTLFATCLPKHAVLKIWDSIFFEGSEVTLRVALAIWAKLGERIESCLNAHEFYCTMSKLTQEMLEGNLIDSGELMQTVYSMAPFPFPQLAELREKYTYNITPFTAAIKPASSSGMLNKSQDGEEEIDMDDEDAIANVVGCLGPFSGLLATELQKYQKQVTDDKEEQSLGSNNIAELSPGAIDSNLSECHAVFNSMMMERMTTDISALKCQYSRIKKKQQQQVHHVYINADKGPVTSLLPCQISQTPVINHLLLGKRMKSTNKTTRNAIVHVTGSKISFPHEDLKTKLNSPWRTHIRVHRKNIARAKGQLGYGDTVGLIEEQCDIIRDGNSKAKESTQSPTRTPGEVMDGTEDRAVLEADGQSPKSIFKDTQAIITEVQHRLETLELKHNENIECLPMTKQYQRRLSDSSSSESGTLCQTLRASTSKSLVFSPFPSVKPLKKSATARNLGLYGPTERTPTVHFPQMSKSVNTSLDGNSGSKKR